MKQKMNITFREVISHLPKEKRKADGTMSKFLYRPLSYPITCICLKLGISANAVSLFSIFVSVLGLVFTFLPFRIAHYGGIGLFLFFAILDCVDGNIARIAQQKQEKTSVDSVIKANQSGAHLGEWMDALAGYFAWTCILFGMGFTSFYFCRVPYDFFACYFLHRSGAGFWLLIAGLASSSNLLARLVFQSWRVATGTESRSNVASEKRLSEEIGITGFLQIFYLVGFITGYLGLVLIAYMGMFVIACIRTSYKLVRTTKK